MVNVLHRLIVSIISMLKIASAQTSDRFTLSVNTNKVEELIARLGLLLKAAKNTARDGAGSRLFNTAHHHAQVARLHDYSDALGLEDLHDGVGDFFGEAFLDL
jgi:hypothetical protein